ncbi:MAG: hypothetical protein ACJ8FY_23440 [Gemmataceae bacterium]
MINTTMSTILTQHYGKATGPLGFPLLDKQAFALEAILRNLPKDDTFSYRKSLVDQGPTEVSPGERSDVSWISTEHPDRMSEVVIARGMDDSQFRLNPLVTLNHAYWAPPAGKSLWRKVVKDGSSRGIKAKTVYPARPANWTEETWVPDLAFALVQADLLRGKSIGFLPTKVHVPDAKEMTRNGWKNVALVIDEWILLEYACVYLPAQQNAVVEAVSKTLPALPEAVCKALGINSASIAAPTPEPQPQPAPEPEFRNGENGLELGLGLGQERGSFLSLDDIAALLRDHVDNLDLETFTQDLVQKHLDRWRGRV